MFNSNLTVILGEYMVVMQEDLINTVVVHVLPPVVVQILIVLCVAMVDVILEFLYVLPTVVWDI